MAYSKDKVKSRRDKSIIFLQTMPNRKTIRHMFTYLEFAVAWCSRKGINSETSLLVMPFLKLTIVFL